MGAVRAVPGQLVRPLPPTAGPAILPAKEPGLEPLRPGPEALKFRLLQTPHSCTSVYVSQGHVHPSISSFILSTYICQALGLHQVLCSVPR